MINTVLLFQKSIKIEEKETAPELHKQQNKNLALQRLGHIYKLTYMNILKRFI